MAEVYPAGCNVAMAEIGHRLTSALVGRRHERLRCDGERWHRLRREIVLEQRILTAEDSSHFL